MKYNFTLLLLLLSLTFISCKKDKPSALPLMGTWELRRHALENTNTVYPPGNGNTLKFSDRNRYERYDSTEWLDGYQSSTFRLTSEMDRNTKERVNLIRFGNSSTREIYNVKNDTLWLSLYPYDDEGNFLTDGQVSTYVRIKE